MTPDSDGLDDKTAAAANASAGGDKRTAVIVIHGMGEQRPMDTLWGFVDAVWVKFDGLVGRRRTHVYAKPDSINGSYELRRITTMTVNLENGAPRRLDFFEFYWAHLMTDNALSGVLSWLYRLVVRNPFETPARLLPIWLASAVLMLIGVVLAGYASISEVRPYINAWLGLETSPRTAAFTAAAISFGFALLARNWIGPVLGDAARYLSPTPDNVAVRQKIRESGIALLKRLHESKRYDRIIVVAHSLGTVIAFDILNYAWSSLDSAAKRQAHAAGSEAMNALAAVERAAGDLKHADEADIEARRVVYRNAQRRYFKALARTLENPLWLVSDLITLGSPLCMSDVLLAAGARDFAARCDRREIPMCPPSLEKDDRKLKKFRFSYNVDDPSRIPHHAAVFAPVVWTNIYFRNFLFLFGDIIGGPVAGLLGRGVRDVPLEISGPAFRHLDYWKLDRQRPAGEAVDQLRQALNYTLLDE